MGAFSPRGLAPIIAFTVFEWLIMPPIHPAVVHLPIALIVFSVLADLLGSWTRSDSLRAAGYWTLMAAAVTAVAAVAAGYYDMSRAALDPELDGLVHLHLRLGWAVLIVVIILALWRWYLYIRDRRRLGFFYHVAALLMLGLTTFQGWYGGEMVFAYGTSVAAAGKV